MASTLAHTSNSPLELQELEPSPVDDTPSISVSGSYFPEVKSQQQRSSTFLGLRDHNINWWLTRVQRVTTYPLTAFAVLHITNTSIIPLATQSTSAADTYLLLTRPYYQSYPLEIVLLAVPAALHVVSGLALRFLRRQRALRNAGFEAGTTAATALSISLKRRAWPRLSATSALGYAFAPVLAFHLALTRAAPTKASVPNVDLSYIAHAVAQAPFVGTISLTALIAVAASHITLGWSKWLGLSPSHAVVATSGRPEDKRKAGTRRWLEIASTTIALAGLWLSGGIGVVARAGKTIGWEGRNFDKILNQIPTFK